MALHSIYKVNPQCSWAVWQIAETETHLQSLLCPNDVDAQYLSKISHREKRKEFFAARLALQALLEAWQQPYTGLPKDEHDKPYLSHLPYQVSISHTCDSAVAILHQTQAIGIDIEPRRQKLWRIAHKFLDEQERSIVEDSLDKLTLAWVAKEAIYKLHGKKKLSFKNNMQILPFEVRQKGSFVTKLIQPQVAAIDFEIFYQKHHNNYIAYTYQGAYFTKSSSI